MQPSVAATAATMRPAASASQGEVGAVLRDGRVLAGHVAEAHGDGTLLLAIGRHRVPAETALRLDPGQSFLVRVEGSGEGAVLHLLGPSDPLVGRLLEALRGVVGEERPIGWLLEELAARLRGELASERAMPGRALAELKTLLASLSGHVGSPADGRDGLIALLARAGVHYEAALVAALASGPSAAVLDRLRANLKAQLLGALSRLPGGPEAGPVKELLARVLTAIEAEQLLNVARRSAGEPLVWSFPFPDAGGWTTARLVLPPDRDGRRGADEREAKDPGSTLVLSVSFSRIGPVRAELTLGPKELAVRLEVSRPELVGRVQADFEELARRLGDGERTVRLFARVGAPERFEEDGAGGRAFDIEFLRRHHMMDVEG